MKRKYILFGITFIFCILHSQTRDPQLDEELKVWISDGSNRVIQVTNETQVYGDINNGYPPLSSGYHNYTNNGQTNNIGLAFGQGLDIYYAKYKITVDNQYFVFADFNDHHYGDYVGLHGTNYNDPDIVIIYNPSNHSFQNVPHIGDTYNISNGYIVSIWKDGRKTPALSGGTGPFGSPAIPSNFDSQIVSTGSGTYSPKLTWNENEERDIDGYQLWRRLDGGSWGVKANLNHPTTSYTDHSVVITGKNTKYANYKLKARDWGNLYSGFTHVETVRYNWSEGRLIDNDMNKIANVEMAPEEFTLFQNSPNPFNPSTTISFALPEPCNVNLTIYDIMGNKIDQIFLDDLASGKHQLRWNGEKPNGESVASGIYIYKIEAIALMSGKVYSENKKMHYLR